MTLRTWIEKYRGNEEWKDISAYQIMNKSKFIEFKKEEDTYIPSAFLVDRRPRQQRPAPVNPFVAPNDNQNQNENQQ